MNIETLNKIKEASTKALKSRQKLERWATAYRKGWDEGNMTRAKTTTYNANVSNEMKYFVEPNEKILREILTNENQ